MNVLQRPALQTLIALALGAILLYAAYDKILHPAEFARIVYHYQAIGPSQHIGPWAANLLAVTLPWIEVVAGLALISGIWRREAAVVTSALLVVFVVAVSSALLRGIDIENCGCFTVSGEGRAAGLTLILGDLAMLAGALVLALVVPRRAEQPAGAASSQVTVS